MKREIVRRVEAVIRGLDDRRLLPFTVFLVALIVVLAAQMVVPRRFFQTHLPPDYVNYYKPAAENIVAGNGVIDGNGTLLTRYPPGFPLILAGLFKIRDLSGLPEQTVINTMIVVCAALAVVGVFCLTRILLDVEAALVAGFLWMTYPFALHLISQPFSELPFMVVFLATLSLFWYVLKQRPSAYGLFGLCGVGAGAAMLIRPAAIGLGVILIAIIWIVRYSLRLHTRILASLALLVGTIGAVLPWQMYASTIYTGPGFVLSTNGVASVMDGLTFLVNNVQTAQTYDGRYPDDVEDFQAVIFAKKQQGELVSLSDLVSFLIQESRENAAPLIKTLLVKLGRGWYGTDSMEQDNLILIIQLPYLTLAVAGFIMLWRRLAAQRPVLIGLLLLVLYFWLMTTAVLSILRYMIPAMAILMIFISGAGVQAVRSRIQTANP